MNVYRVSQTINNKYDTYDSCIVFAESEDDARNNNIKFDKENEYLPDWVKESEKHLLEIEFLWELVPWSERDTWVILWSFHAW